MTGEVGLCAAVGARVGRTPLVSGIWRTGRSRLDVRPGPPKMARTECPFGDGSDRDGRFARVHSGFPIVITSGSDR
jgi:hypothetical protein